MTLYYEVHVTLEPDFDRLEEAREIAKRFHYHLGDLLLMKKDDERSHKDMFFTTRKGSNQDARWSVVRFVQELQKAGFRPIRYKIEDTVLDSKIEDELQLLVDI